MELNFCFSVAEKLLLLPTEQLEFRFSGQFRQCNALLQCNQPPSQCNKHIFFKLGLSEPDHLLLESDSRATLMPPPSFPESLCDFNFMAFWS